MSEMCSKHPNQVLRNRKDKKGKYCKKCQDIITLIKSGDERW